MGAFTQLRGGINAASAPERAEPGTGWRVRLRQSRTIATDLSLIGIVGVLGIGMHGDVLATDPPSFVGPVNLAIWPLAMALVPLRRFRPELFAVLALVLASGFYSACALSLVAVFAVGARLPSSRAIPWIGVLSVPVWINSLLYPATGTGTYVGDVVFGTLVTISLGAWGMYVGTRRQLLESLRERAARTEAEQQLRVEQARHQERTRIAREMHDVLAHRMSLLSVHAGALEFRADAPPEEVSRAAGVIRATAHEALEELRTIIGVLRVDELAGDETGAPSSSTAPQPTLGDLPRLVDEWRAAGARVDFDLALDERARAQVPEAIGRTAYRVVQEALTNARKHAPGARVQLTVERARRGLRIAVDNPLPAGGPAGDQQIPGTGVGLIGMRERVELAGGTFDAGAVGGGYHVVATLPIGGA